MSKLESTLGHHILTLDLAPDTEEQKEVLRSDPKKYLIYRKTIESELNSRFKFIINGSKEQAEARAVSNYLEASAIED